MKYTLDYSADTIDLKTNPGYENKSTATDKLVEKYNSPKQLDFNFDKKPIAEPTKKQIEKKIAIMGDPKSNGAWKNFVEESNNIENKENELGKLVRHGVAPQDKKKKKISVLDYIDKVKDNYNDNLRPKEASPEMVGELATKLERQRQMTGGPSTWDIMKKAATTPEEKNQIKRILNRDFNKNGPKNMSNDDLKFIGKYKQPTYPEIKVPIIDESLFSRPTPQLEPQIPLREQIRVLADRRLEREQRAWDREHGKDGITNVLRPK